MKKHTKIIAGLCAAVLSATAFVGVAGCNKSTVKEYPNFVNSGNTGDDKPSEEKYVVNVLSEGGMKLDGVRVIAKRNGTEVKRAISNGGKIELAVSLGEYQLEIDETSLPAGYYLPEQKYVTSATSREEITIRIPSRLLGAGETCGYRVGDIMKDFTFKDYNGVSHRLSEDLKTKRAVILNFWYVRCPNCDSEFPAIQSVYSKRDDVEIYAINPIDSAASGSAYQKDKELTFPMGEDRVGLGTSFNVNAYPTTIVIDKYGLIAASHDGGQPDTAFWSNLFNIYTDDNYVQNITTGGDIDDGNQTNPELMKPNVSMPTSDAMANAASGEGFIATYREDKEDEYSWPWVVGEDETGTYIQSSNIGKGNSYAVLYMDVDMKAGDVLSFDYNVDSEAERDFLSITIDGILITGDTGISATNGWHTLNAYVADRESTVEVGFVYKKDAADPADFNKKDTAMIRDIHLTTTAVFSSNPIDVLRTAANGGIDKATNNRYNNYVTAVYNANDGFYHKDTTDGDLLFMSISNITPFSELHTGNLHEAEGEDDETYYNTLYYMTYYNYGRVVNGSFNCVINDTDVTSTVISYQTIQAYMPAPYYLLPVTKELKIWAEEFTKAYDSGRGYHNEQWLEFCFYYDHYGSEDHDHGVDSKGNKINCEAIYDRTRGLTTYNCYEAFEKTDAAITSAETYNAEHQRLVAEMNFPMQPINGTYFKFEVKKDGVYHIRPYTGTGISSENAMPSISVFGENGTQYIGGSDSVREHSVKRGEESLSGFSYYLTAHAGEVYYLQLETAPNSTGYYEFEIEWLGTSYETMLIASTGDGAWTGELGDKYIAINVKYYEGDAGDPDADCHYKTAPNGELLMDQPIYIDFTGESCLYSDIPNSTYKSLEWLINNRYFSEVQNGYLIQPLMEKLLAEAKQPENNGMLKASAALVGYINALLDKHVDGGSGQGNGWLTFACYMEKFSV